MLVSKLTAYAVVSPQNGFAPSWTEEEAGGGTASNTLESLTSTASGTFTAPITGTASNTLDALTSTTAGTASGPGFTQRIGLMGTMRPTKSLNATWVPR